MKVEAQDWLWRDQAEMHAALRRLRFWSVSVFSIETGADITDQSGRLVASVKGLMDEAYLDTLREKTSRGMLG
jgi:site-specific DNA recombinase